MQAVEQYYNHFLSSPSQILSNFDIPAEHSWVTNGEGNDCGSLETPYVNNCSYSSSGKYIRSILYFFSFDINLIWYR